MLETSWVEPDLHDKQEVRCHAYTQFCFTGYVSVAISGAHYMSVKLQAALLASYSAVLGY